MKVAAIILNYNSSEDCAKCVSFLKRQKEVALEIILVDNCSQPSDRERIHQLSIQENCTLISSPTNGGYSAGNNIGLRYAAEKGYQYALIANPDMEFPQTDYVARLAAQLDSDPEVVALGSDIVGTDGAHQSPMKAERNWVDSLDWIKGLLTGNQKSAYIENYQHSHYCQKLGGCCLMLRLDFVKSIGYLDEYPFLYCEEAILARQVQLQQKKIYYLAEAQALHRHLDSEKGDPAWRFRQWCRSRLYYIEKYSGFNGWGRMVAKCSIRLYITLLTIACKRKTSVTR